MEAQLIEWLEKRILATELEKENSSNMNTKIAKGGKLTAYKGMLDYVKTHKD